MATQKQSQPQQPQAEDEYPATGPLGDINEREAKRLTEEAQQEVEPKEAAKLPNGGARPRVTHVDATQENQAGAPAAQEQD